MYEFSKKEVIKILEEIALLLELKGENPFKTRTYSNASRILNNLDDDLATLIKDGELIKLKEIN